MAKRLVEIIIKSEELSVQELKKIAETLNNMEDWQLMGERPEDVGNFRMETTWEPTKCFQCPASSSYQEDGVEENDGYCLFHKRKTLCPYVGNRSYP